MKTTATIVLLAAGLIVSFSCRKGSPTLPEIPPEEKPQFPDPVLYRLDSTLKGEKPGFPGRYTYNSDNKLTKVEVNDPFNTEYFYDSDGQVIRLVRTAILPEVHTSTDIKINYKNGIPVTGTRNEKPYQNKVAYPYHYIDSMRYHVTDGKVRKITYFHRQMIYAPRLNMNTLDRGIQDEIILHYDGDNWTGFTAVNTKTGNTISYGSKKGIFSAFRMKYVLFENDIAMLHSSNELLSEEFRNGVKTSYEYVYDSAGYPRSAIINQQNNSYKITYFYK